MATPALVSEDIEMGRELINILDEAGFPVTGAAWIYAPDLEEWRLRLRTPKAKSDPLGALRELANAADAKGDLRARIDLSRVKLVPPDDRMLAAIGSLVKADGLSSIRFSRNVVDGLLIDDALIYRLAA